MLKGEINSALVAHIKWLVIFKNHLAGVERDQLDPEVVGDHTACIFGQWLYANKAALPCQEEFEHIDSLHALFHSAAAEVAEAIQAKHPRKEIEHRLSELQSLSNQLIAALNEVKASLFPVGRPDR